MGTQNYAQKSFLQLSVCLLFFPFCEFSFGSVKDKKGIVKETTGTICEEKDCINVKPNRKNSLVTDSVIRFH